MSKIYEVVFYKNRKLYCKQKSGYITLADVYNMYRNGNVITISEHDSKKNITQDVLVKSIMHHCPSYEMKIKLLNQLMQDLRQWA